MSLIFLVNMRGLFLGKTEKVLLLLMHFKVFYTVQNANQAKYGLIKVVNFITTLSKMVKRESHRRGFNIQ